MDIQFEREPERFLGLTPNGWFLLLIAAMILGFTTYRFVSNRR